MVADKLDNRAEDKGNRGFLHRFTTSRNRIPLRTVLVVPFVLQIVGTVAIVQYLSFKNSHEAVSDVVSELRSEVSDRIEQHLSDYLKKPYLINQKNILSHKIGLLDISNQDALGRQFWRQRQVYNVNAVYFGNPEGGYVASEPGNTITITENFLPGQFFYYNTNSKGLKLGNPKIGHKYFDSRTRPWYKAPVSKGTSTWSEIYTYADGSDIAIAAATPMYENNELLGVFSVDLSLNQLNDFFREIKVGKTGRNVIVESSGSLGA